VLLYSRDLPGGGIVRIESDTVDGPTIRAELTVERRTDPVRRVGHRPPVIAQASGPTRTSVLNELYAIASDNVAIARGLIRWQSARRDR
jgi:hypothetical protein